MTATPGGMLNVEPSRYVYLRTLTFDMAQERLHNGLISQDEWEAWAHVWRTSAPRFGSTAAGYADHPTDPAVALIATQLGGCCQYGQPRRPMMDHVPCDYNGCPSYAVWIISGRGDDDYLCATHYAAERVQ